MFLHVFGFRWQPAATETQKTQALEAIRAFEGQIPGLLKTYVGINTSPRSQGYALGGVMHFADRDAFETYNTHPVHQDLIAWLMPLIEPVEIDFYPLP